MSTTVLLERYEQVYRKLHQRGPDELRDLGSGWVVVNGARMRVAELERLTEELYGEYRRTNAEKRSIIKRLVGWLRNG
jgi:hypothetical protein